MRPFAHLLLHGALIVTLTTGVVVPTVALAQAGGGFKSGFDAVNNAREAAGVRDFGSISGFILAVLAVIASLVAVLALVALVYGAILYITSFGDEGKIDKAKDIIKYALIGILILGISGIVVNVVINLIRR